MPTLSSRAVLLLALSLVFGCGQENFIPPAQPDRADLYWDLALNHHAVVLDTMAPYDTLRLVATPRNYRGEPLVGLPAAQYQSADPDKVAVTDDGLLVALGRTPGPIAVVATLTTDNLKHADTVIVNVVDDPTPPLLTDFSIQPVPPDSAKAPTLSLGNLAQPLDTLPVRAVSSTGDPIPIYLRDPGGVLPVDFRLSDTSMAQFAVVPEAGTVGAVRGLRPGTLQVYASTTAFGVTKADTLDYRIGWPVLAIAWIVPNGTDGALGVYGPDIKIGTGGAVVWALRDVPADFSDTVDVTFADADVPNILPVRPVVDRLATFNSMAPVYFCSFDCDNGGSFLFIGVTQGVGRYFPVPGTYVFHSTRHGFSGRITVVDER